jgi:hypothetical protein
VGQFCFGSNNGLDYRPKSLSRIKGNFETWTRLGLFMISQRLASQAAVSSGSADSAKSAWLPRGEPETLRNFARLSDQ